MFSGTLSSWELGSIKEDHNCDQVKPLKKIDDLKTCCFALCFAVNSGAKSSCVGDFHRFTSSTSTTGLISAETAGPQNTHSAYTAYRLAAQNRAAVATWALWGMWKVVADKTASRQLPNRSRVIIPIPFSRRDVATLAYSAARQLQQ